MTIYIDLSKTFSVVTLITLLSGLAILMPLVIDIFLPAIPAIAQSFQVSTGDIQITLASLNLGAAIGQLLYGPLADRFGRRWVIIVSMSIFSISGFATAAAPNLEWLNILRFVQGLTAASGMIIIRAKTRSEAEAIAFEEPFTKAGHRKMVLYPWQRNEGSVDISIRLMDSVMEIDSRTYDLVPRKT